MYFIFWSLFADAQFKLKFESELSRREYVTSSGNVFGPKKKPNRITYCVPDSKKDPEDSDVAKNKIKFRNPKMEHDVIPVRTRKLSAEFALINARVGTSVGVCLPSWAAPGIVKVFYTTGPARMYVKYPVSVNIWHAGVVISHGLFGFVSRC